MRNRTDWKCKRSLPSYTAISNSTAGSHCDNGIGDTILLMHGMVFWCSIEWKVAHEGGGPPTAVTLKATQKREAPEIEHDWSMSSCFMRGICCGCTE